VLSGLSWGSRSAIAPGPKGTPVVLKWSRDEAMADRYTKILPGLDELRARGVPVPEYLDVIPFDGGTLSAQQLLPGRAEDNPSPAIVDQMIRYVAAKMTGFPKRFCARCN
jgi:hypothetical protein